MAKIITDKEIGKMISNVCNDIEVIDDQDQYLKFLNDLAGVITKHFGGNHSKPFYAEGDGLGYTVAFNVNDSVPDDGGIYRNYDPDVEWIKNKEMDRILVD